VVPSEDDLAVRIQYTYRRTRSLGRDGVRNRVGADDV